MRHLGCWIIYMQNDCFIYCLFLAALKCWSICSKIKSTFTKTTLFHSGMSIEISSFQSMFCKSEMLQHAKIQNRYNDCASSREPNSRLTILHVGLTEEREILQQFFKQFQLQFKMKVISMGILITSILSWPNLDKLNKGTVIVYMQVQLRMYSTCDALKEFSNITYEKCKSLIAWSFVWLLIYYMTEKIANARVLTCTAVQIKNLR